MGFPNGDLGPGRVIWDADGTALDLGPTFGGIVFSDETKYREIKEDEYGDSAVDHVFMGRVCTITAKFTRSALAQLEKMIPSASLAGSVLTVKASVGTQARALAKRVTIKRIIDGVVSGTTTEWLTLLKAYPISAKPTLNYDTDNQRIVEVVFAAYPSDTSGQIGEMWKLGA